MKSPTTKTRRRPRRRGPKETADTLFLLNCYDIWSATPMESRSCDCGASQGATSEPAEGGVVTV